MNIIKSNYSEPPSAEELRNTIAHRLKEMRLSRRLMQKNVADLADLNVFTYSGYENARATPPADSLLRLAEIFEVSVDFLMGRIDTVRTFVGEDTDQYDDDLAVRVARLEKALRENEIDY